MQRFTWCVGIEGGSKGEERERRKRGRERKEEKWKEEGGGRGEGIGRRKRRTKRRKGQKRRTRGRKDIRADITNVIEGLLGQVLVDTGDAHEVVLGQMKMLPDQAHQH